MQVRGLLSRRAWALAFVLAAVSTVAAVLAGQSARVLVRAPLVERPARGALVAVPLEVDPQVPSTNDGMRHRLALETDAAAELLAHEELWLFLSPAPAPETRVSAAAVQVGEACRFESNGPSAVVEGQPLVLQRGAGCARAAPVDMRRLALEVTTENPATLGLWAHRPREGSAARGRVLVAGTAGAGTLSVRGFVADHPRTAPRIELLSAMWRRAGRTGWLWLLLAAAAVLGLAGVLVQPTVRVPVQGDTARPRYIASCAAGAGLLAGSLALLYVVATPPLGGPDEPYHLMGFAELVGDAPLVDDTLAWMTETHQMRIRHHPEERFRTVDVGAPEATRDPEARATEVAMRSATLAALWRLYGPALAGSGAPRALLGIRLANSLLFAAAMAGAAALAAATASAAYPQWIVLALLFVPSLPFFAMHVSETALLCSVYVLLATSLTVMFLDGPRAHHAGLPLGLSCGLMLAGGRSPWPLAGVVGAALAGRVLLGPSGAARPRRDAVVFWLGFALGASSFHLVINAEFARAAVALSAHAPGPLHAMSRGLLASPALLGLVALAGVGLEIALAAVRASLAPRLAGPARSVARWGGPVLAALVALSLAASLVVAFPHLELEPRHPLTLGERLHDALWTTATLFRLRNPNFLLATSFWVGFGWLDAIPGELFQGLLILLAAAPTTALLVSLGRPPQPRRLAWLLLLAGGSMLSMALYTAITQGQPMALHGRYLIGWYLVLVGSSRVRLGGRRSRPRTPRSRSIAGCRACC